MAEKAEILRTIEREHSCWLCGGDTWYGLPVPRVDAAMLSDGRIVPEPLRKCTCATCGLVQHVDPLSTDRAKAIFGSAYALGEHTPGAGFEGWRQKVYARWIAAALADRPPRSVLELGCGNGSLLLALRQFLPAAHTTGLGPSEQAVARARACGLDVNQAYISSAESVAGREADLVLSVNVIEHTSTPSAFMSAVRAAMREGGVALIVCPDGDVVGSELLFFDHFHSFGAANLESLFSRMGLMTVRHERSPSTLPGFHLLLGTRDPRANERATRTADVPVLHARRCAYLRHWQELDTSLCAALNGRKKVSVFGIGETAQLIRAYAPRAWERIERFVVDKPSKQEFCGRPLVDYADLTANRDELILLAVSRRSIHDLYVRLSSAGHRVLPIDLAEPRTAEGDL